MHNVYINIIFYITCMCEYVYLDRFLSSFLLNNNLYHIQILFCLLWWHSGFAIQRSSFDSVLNS